MYEVLHSLLAIKPTERSNTMNELMIPEASSVPAYLRNPELAKAANEEAAAGISTGFPARVKLNGKQFTLVDGNGEEKAFPQSKLVVGPDENVYLPVIMLRSKKALSKSWHATAFNPAAEAKAPDCFSNDSERPDPTATAPQADTCAVCPMNAYGSGKDQAGNATKGKACADTKINAVFVPGYGVHSFKIPPASLKSFGLYVKQLSAAGIPLNAVKTLVGFDSAASYPVLIFRFGGYLGEELMPKLAEMAASMEVEEIIGGITATAPAAPKQVADPVTKPEPVKEAAKPQEVVTTDDLGLGVVIDVDTAPAQKQAAQPEPQAQPQAQEVTDEQLMAELGL